MWRHRVWYQDSLPDLRWASKWRCIWHEIGHSTGSSTIPNMLMYWSKVTCENVTETVTVINLILSTSISFITLYFALLRWTNIWSCSKSTSLWICRKTDNPANAVPLYRLWAAAGPGWPLLLETTSIPRIPKLTNTLAAELVWACISFEQRREHYKPNCRWELLYLMKRVVERTLLCFYAARPLPDSWPWLRRLIYLV